MPSATNGVESVEAGLHPVLLSCVRPAPGRSDPLCAASEFSATRTSSCRSFRCASRTLTAMAETEDRPTSIELDRNSHLGLGWADGLRVKFDIVDLRLACPCAGCRSRREKGQRSIPDDGNAVAATDAQLVGSYAIGVEWRDGRCSSIYSFDRLRRWAESAKAPEPDIG